MKEKPNELKNSLTEKQFAKIQSGFAKHFNLTLETTDLSGNQISQFCNSKCHPEFCKIVRGSKNDMKRCRQDRKKITLIKPVIDHIEANYDQSIGLGNIAKAAHLSVSRLSHVFKDQMGITVINHLINTRIRHAKRMLLATDKNCAEICSSVGYNNQSYFTRTFKSIVGMTPLQFREKNRRP